MYINEKERLEERMEYLKNEKNIILLQMFSLYLLNKLSEMGCIVDEGKCAEFSQQFSEHFFYENKA